MNFMLHSVNNRPNLHHILTSVCNMYAPSGEKVDRPFAFVWKMHKESAQKSMEYHFLRLLFRNDYLYDMFDILLEIGINYLRLIANRLEID